MDKSPYALSTVAVDSVARQLSQATDGNMFRIAGDQSAMRIGRKEQFETGTISEESNVSARREIARSETQLLTRRRTNNNNTNGI